MQRENGEEYQTETEGRTDGRRRKSNRAVMSTRNHLAHAEVGGGGAGSGPLVEEEE